MTTEALTTAESRPKVLVVDDSLVERNLFVHVVRKWGYSIYVASSGEEALDILRQESIQLVLADWHMPGMSGVELCACIREENFGRYIYIILMSAQQAEEFLIKALQSGADDVLTKPVDTNELEARLQSAERRIELQSRLAHQNATLEQAHDVIAQDLRTVSKVQRSYLPSPTCPFPEMDYCWSTVPSQYVSGDHLNVFRVDKGIYGFYILDVSGHGIPAAVKSMQLVQMFSDQAASSVVYQPGSKAGEPKVPARPRDVVSRLNSIFQQTDTDLSYFTLIYGLFEPEKHTITLCQAGHPSPFLLKADKTIEVIGEGGYPVGLFDFDEYEDTVVQLQPGESFLMYSDGVTEVLNRVDEQFGEVRLQRLLEKRVSGSWTAIPDLVRREITAWGGEPVQQNGFEDDVSLLLLGFPHEHEVSESEETNLLLTTGSMDEKVFKAQSSEHDQPAISENHQHSIMIVDDSRSFLRIFEAMLTSWGYKVTATQGAQQALSLLDTVKPDFVLTDWDMPGMSGIELCEHIRKNAGDNYTYLIMITGYASRDDLFHSLRVGADDFLTKPVNPSELKVRLRTAERIAKLHGDLSDRHAQITRVYQSLQRDMREVARIQRSLLPKNVNSPWPIAIQSLFQPRGYVCGKQFGTLRTRENELGFFMLSLPDNDTSAALQAMALARWFSMDRAIQLLFPAESASTKMRRYLADPEVVWKHLQEITPTLAEEGLEFDLMYGLLNLDQGTFLVGGIGQWELVIAHSQEEPRLISSFNAESKPRMLENGRYASVLYQDVVRPGSRIFALPQSCADELNLSDIKDWEEKILITDVDTVKVVEEIDRLSGRLAARSLGDRADGRKMVSSDLSAEPLKQSASGFDLTLMAFQWREHFEIQKVEFSQDEIRSHMDYVAEIAKGSFDDCLVKRDLPYDCGHFRDAMVVRSVIDPVSIGHLSESVRVFAESLHFDELAAYNVDLALSEALTNIMNHGFKMRRPEVAEVVLMGYQHAMVVIMRDKGSPIPASVLDRIRPDMDYMDDLSLDELPEGGMGLTFISMASNCFRYKSTSAGNELTLLIGSRE